MGVGEFQIRLIFPLLTEGLNLESFDTKLNALTGQPLIPNCCVIAYKCVRKTAKHLDVSKNVIKNRTLAISTRSNYREQKILALPFKQTTLF